MASVLTNLEPILVLDCLVSSTKVTVMNVNDHSIMHLNCSTLLCQKVNFRNWVTVATILRTPWKQSIK